MNLDLVTEEERNINDGENVCLFVYVTPQGERIKNVTFYCHLGCCGVKNSQFCCFSETTILLATIACGMLTTMCLLAFCVYKKCRGRVLQAPQKQKQERKTPGLPNTLWTAGLPVTHIVDSRSYAYVVSPHVCPWPGTVPHPAAPLTQHVASLPYNGCPEGQHLHGPAYPVYQVQYETLPVIGQNATGNQQVCRPNESATLIREGCNENQPCCYSSAPSTASAPNLSQYTPSNTRFDNGMSRI